MPLGLGRRGSRAEQAGGGQSQAVTRVNEWLAVGRRKWFAAALVVLVGLGLGVGAASLAFGLFDTEPPKRRVIEFTRFRDDPNGFSIEYPKTWKRLEPADPRIALIADQGGGASLLVRAVPLNFESSPKRMDLMQAVAGRFVSLNPDAVPLARPRRIKVDGLPAIQYFYSFRDRGTGLRGTHSHYFIFDGRRMIIVILQALPTERIARFAPVFDAIIGSYRDESRVRVATPPPDGGG